MKRKTVSLPQHIYPTFYPLTIVLLTCYLNAADKDAEYPLEDVERGMLGEWRTVIAGTKIETQAVTGTTKLRAHNGSHHLRGTG